MTTSLYTVEADLINVLDDRQLVSLLRILLTNEASKSGIPLGSVDVSDNINAGDGGEDGSIVWDSIPNSTNFLPSQHVSFQCKATDIAPRQCADEITANPNSKEEPLRLKPKLREALEAGGYYILATTQKLSASMKTTRLKKLKERAGQILEVDPDSIHIDIFDADKLAIWANCFLPAVIKVREWTGAPILSGLKSFLQWGELDDIRSIPYIQVDSRREMLEEVSEKISAARSCYRITGPAGIGKTRAVYELFNKFKHLQSFVIYADTGTVPNIRSIISDLATTGITGFLVIDNCPNETHNALMREVRTSNSKLSLLTIDYSPENVGHSTNHYRLGPISEKEILQIIKSIHGDSALDELRIAELAQGFPQMAVLIANARIDHDPTAAELSDDEIAKKLLWARGETEDDTKLELLKACSLFDVFGIEGEYQGQLEFISSLANLSFDQGYSIIQNFTRKGIVDRRERFGQVTPRPLAIRLAAQWWQDRTTERIAKVIESIPPQLVESFCLQIEKLNYHPDVTSLTEQLCGPQDPFGQAKVILSSRGSRLFRSISILNPTAFSISLLNVLESLPDIKIEAIQRDVRRNLVWTLEKLCFHESAFTDACGALFLLAKNETENLGNNATGIFNQLFRMRLSGTAASPKIKFKFLARKLDEQSDEEIKLVLTALASALNIEHGSIMRGAESQGSLEPMQEWKPDTWGDAFSYWDRALDLLEKIAQGNSKYRIDVLDIFGGSIRQLVRKGRIESVECTIKSLFDDDPANWLAAIDSINQVHEFEFDQLPADARDKIISWKELLTPKPTDLASRIQLTVITPPHSYTKSWNDIEDSELFELAEYCRNNLPEFKHNIAALHMQNPSLGYQFGLAVTKNDADIRSIVSESLTVIKNHINEKYFFNFTMGLFRGTFEKDSRIWEDYMEEIYDDNELSILYTNFLYTGIISNHSLLKIIDLIDVKKIPASTVTNILHIDGFNEIDQTVFLSFLTQLFSQGEHSAWMATRLISQLDLANNGHEEMIAEISSMFFELPIHCEVDTASVDMQAWETISNYLLDNSLPSAAISLSNQILGAASKCLDHHLILESIRSIVSRILAEQFHESWPIFGDAILAPTNNQYYWLEQIFSGVDDDMIGHPSILENYDPEKIINWCRNSPIDGAIFIATCMNIFNGSGREKKPTKLFVLLLETFGNNDEVCSRLASNLGTRSWMGSIIPVLESDIAALKTLNSNRNKFLRNWVDRQLEYSLNSIKHENVLEKENSFWESSHLGYVKPAKM